MTFPYDRFPGEMNPLPFIGDQYPYNGWRRPLWVVGPGGHEGDDCPRRCGTSHRHRGSVDATLRTRHTNPRHTL